MFDTGQNAFRHAVSQTAEDRDGRAYAKSAGCKWTGFLHLVGLESLKQWHWETDMLQKSYKAHQVLTHDPTQKQ